MLEIYDSFERGGNRLGKIKENASRILLGTPKEVKALLQLIPVDAGKSLNTPELNSLSIALSALAFPSFYELLSFVAKQFKVQNLVSRASINQKMAAIYGNSRATSLGIDAMIPMLVEAGFLQRVSLGKYSIGTLSFSLNSLVAEFWIRAEIILTHSRAILAEELLHHPWNDFCPGVELALKAPKILKMETMVGNKVYIRL